MEVHKKWALEYEIQSSSCLMSLINRYFFNYFMWRFEIKYKRYMEFREMQIKEDEKIMIHAKEIWE